MNNTYSNNQSSDSTPYSPLTWYHSELTISAMMMSFLSFILNMIIFYKLCTKKYLKKPLHRLIANLALTDIIHVITYSVMATFPLIVNTYRQLFWKITPSAANITCKIVFYIYVASITTSTSTLLVIGAERYRAITYPLRRTYTRKQMNRILMAILAISFSSTLLIIFTRNYDRSSILNCTGSLSPYKSFITAISFTVYAIATYGIPTVIIIIFYICIIVSLYYYNLPKGDSEYRAEVNKSRQKKNQVIMALLIITILSAASYFPFMAIHVGIAFLKYSTNNAIKDLPKLFWIFYRLTAILMLIPTILNPILYNFASSEIKKEMKAFTVNLPRIPARKCCIHFRKANRLTPVLKM